jgi:hypothetical protein
MKNTNLVKTSLFSRDAIKKLRRDRFTGMLLVNWENGMIDDLVLETGNEFDIRRLEDRMTC